ncbi:hypothetical protein SAY86_025337 [Trapa natans]|uniref:Pectinesterase n=1 Tax=Trapa natans TaxID=22666 RepID=A0AAN7MIU0_TRANT|nr:hypothetical protein SAY86_025337 [Trapa natans]
MRIISFLPFSSSLFFTRCSFLALMMMSSSFVMSSTNNHNEPPTGGGGLEISSWCNTTPHPDPCNDYFMAHRSPDTSVPKDRSGFRQIMVQATLNQALQSHAQVRKLGSQCDNSRKKGLWSDCSKLYEDTVLQLNRTLEGLYGGDRKRINCSSSDAQTWLSTALTNIEMCRLGFQDLNIPDFISSTSSRNNLSQLISNTLAVNGAMVTSSSRNPEDHEFTRWEKSASTQSSSSGSRSSDDDGFPSWFSVHDRKLLQTTSSGATKANVVVAKDGSGNYRTVQAAINVAAKRISKSQRFVIYVKRGVYRENIEVGIGNDNIMMVGDGMAYSVITGSRSVGGGYTTYSSATAGIDGLKFIARGITFRNTAGAQKGQAVALRSASDLSVFYQCSFQGYQDTLFVLSQRQFYKQCHIYGTIDFIFGNAAVVFQSCTIYARLPIHGQSNVITAQGRNDPYQNTGISFHSCRILAAPDLSPSISTVKTYLGRPWMPYSRTVYLKSYLGALVAPQGWSTWDGSNYALNTLYYGEYRNYGPGASTQSRVKWKGYRVMTSATEASRFSVGTFIAGNSWLPATSIPFTAGL